MEMNHIRQYIDENGIKHTWVADRLHISKSYLSLILSGTRTAPQWFEERINKILKIKKGETNEQRKSDL